jgi:hypothetical protein
MNDLEGDVVVLREDKKGLAFAHITREPVTLEDYDEFIIPPAKPQRYAGRKK